MLNRKYSVLFLLPSTSFPRTSAKSVKVRQALPGIGELAFIPRTCSFCNRVAIKLFKKFLGLTTA